MADASCPMPAGHAGAPPTKGAPATGHKLNAMPVRKGTKSPTTLT